MKLSDIPTRLSQEMQDLSIQLLPLATASWQQLKKNTEIMQEIAKDPLSEPVKAQAATAEFLSFFLHTCDRIASAAFNATVAEDAAATLRGAFMTGLVGATIAAFMEELCEEETEEEQEATQADLLYLYNTRAMQYGFLPLGSAQASHHPEPLFTLAGIRLAEALECADNANIIIYAIEVIMTGLTTLQQQLPLKDTISRLIATLH